MGSIRKVTKSVKGKEYTYYEARYTVGFDPGTGKQIQRSVTDKSKKIVAQKILMSGTSYGETLNIEVSYLPTTETVELPTDLDTYVYQGSSF